MAKNRWISVIAAVVVGMVSVVMGAVIGLWWSGRESLLVNRRHKGVVAKDDHADFMQRYRVRRLERAPKMMEFEIIWEKW